MWKVFGATGGASQTTPQGQLTSRPTLPAPRRGLAMARAWAVPCAPESATPLLPHAHLLWAEAAGQVESALDAVQEVHQQAELLQGGWGAAVV